MSKVVSEEVMQELITKLESIFNNYCWNLEYFTDDEVEGFFQASADEVTFYNGLINDKIESQNFLWSSKHVAEKIAQSIIEANGYTDNMIKNIASIKLKYVTSLPTSEISENTIYILKASDGTSKDTLNLYNATDGWTSIGEFTIDLTNYIDRTTYDTDMDLKANKTEVVANDKIVQTLDSTTNSSDTVLSTSGLQTKMDLKANDNEVVKKTDITTTIDSTSTDDAVPSAKAVFNLDITNFKMNSSFLFNSDTDCTDGKLVIGQEYTAKEPLLPHKMARLNTWWRPCQFTQATWYDDTWGYVDGYFSEYDGSVNHFNIYTIRILYRHADTKQFKVAYNKRLEFDLSANTFTCVNIEGSCGFGIQIFK